MFALLAVLASAAITVVSAQDPVVFSTPGSLFDKSFTSSCSINVPQSCSLPNPEGQDSCCYESPRVCRVRPKSLGARELTHV
jgi:hypothetical protein